MTDLLAADKRRLLAEHGYVTLHDFEQAWAQSWEVMVLEHAWPHATVHRRGWRTAMLATRSELRAAWLGQPTAFAVAVERLTDIAPGPLDLERVPKILLACMGYTAGPDDLGAL
jgi:hypothetical protein